MPDPVASGDVCLVGSRYDVLVGNHGFVAFWGELMRRTCVCVCF